MAAGKVDYNYTLQEFPAKRHRGPAFFLQGFSGRRLPHVLYLRSRRGSARRHLHDPRYGAQGA
jgi:hypothetical protein